MATGTEPRTITGEERFLLTGISWNAYRVLCDDVDGRTYRLSYDCGNLEIMITKSPHEYYKKLLAKLIELIVFELNIPVRSGGSMTFQREDLEKGFEPDECWWIAHERQVRGRSEFDFLHDPPPDLAVEVEITSSLVSRVGIYAAMQVPEVWRYDGQTLRFCVLQADGAYQPHETSHTFPFLRPQHLRPYLKLDPNVDETTVMRQFAQWFREQEFSL